MTDFTDYILTALALVFVIEGLMYALFPEAIRRMMAMAISMEAPQLRKFGVSAVFIGLALLWILRWMNTG